MARPSPEAQGAGTNDKAQDTNGSKGLEKLLPQRSDPAGLLKGANQGSVSSADKILPKVDAPSEAGSKMAGAQTPEKSGLNNQGDKKAAPTEGDKAAEPPLQKQAKELMGIIKAELRNDDPKVSTVAEDKLREAFKKSTDPDGLAHALADIGAADRVQVSYDHGIHFYSLQQREGGSTGGGGTLVSYNGQIPSGKPLGITNEQIKPLANAVRAITSRDGELTHLYLARKLNNNPALLEQARFAGAVLANTGKPEELVSRINKQMTADDKSEGLGHTHELSYTNRVNIRIDWPAPTPLEDQAAAARNANPGRGFATLDEGKTYVYSVSLE